MQSGSDGARDDNLPRIDGAGFETTGTMKRTCRDDAPMTRASVSPTKTRGGAVVVTGRFWPASRTTPPGTAHDGAIDRTPSVTASSYSSSSTFQYT
jgi:hypothetical protein